MYQFISNSNERRAICRYVVTPTFLYSAVIISLKYEIIGHLASVFIGAILMLFGAAIEEYLKLLIISNVCVSIRQILCALLFPLIEVAIKLIFVVFYELQSVDVIDISFIFAGIILHLTTFTVMRFLIEFLAWRRRHAILLAIIIHYSYNFSAIYLLARHNYMDFGYILILMILVVAILLRVANTRAGTH